MCVNSASDDTSVFSGTSKFVSSAYFTSKLTSEMGCKSLSIMIHNVGPVPDPCLNFVVKVTMHKLEFRLLSMTQSIIQGSGIGPMVILMCAECERTIFENLYNCLPNSDCFTLLNSKLKLHHNNGQQVGQYN